MCNVVETVNSDETLLELVVEFKLNLKNIEE